MAELRRKALDYEEIRDTQLTELSGHAWNGLVEQSERIYDFYGASENQFKLDGMVWEAFEDPEDGYRSCLGCITVVPECRTIFFDQPIARIKVARAPDYNPYDSQPDDPFDGWSLIDVEDSHVWLTFGTNHSDSYYPSFTFDYNPKKPEGELK